MMRGNYRLRKLILLMALISIIGAGFGCLSDDGCPVLASYADDPGGPAPTTNVVVMVISDPLSVAFRTSGSTASVPADNPRGTPGTELSSARAQSASPAVAVPRRC